VPGTDAEREKPVCRGERLAGNEQMLAIGDAGRKGGYLKEKELTKIQFSSTIRSATGREPYGKLGANVHLAGTGNERKVKKNGRGVEGYRLTFDSTRVFQENDARTPRASDHLRVRVGKNPQQRSSERRENWGAEVLT